MQPLGSRLLIEAIERQDIKLRSGFIVPAGWETAAESIHAKILAVGPDAQGFAVGQTVVIAQFAPTKAQMSPTDKTFIVPAEDVLAVVTPDKSAK